MTHVACLTPPGTSALATLALAGPRAWPLVRELFRPRRGSLPVEPEVNRPWLGRLGESVADDVVLCVRARAPEPCIEIHCHGGPEVIRLLLELFEAHGVRVCSWQELEAQAADPLHAAAVAALAEARTVRTASILLDQVHGAFRREEDSILAAWRAGARDSAGLGLQALVERVPLGRHLTVPWRVVVAGAPNVGKSSLVNALAGYARCVVSPLPGTTRDVVTTLIAVEGWPVELADTAGLREAEGHLEEQGMERARAVLASADLCLWVLDAAAPPVWPELGGERVRLVVNKCDLPAAWDLDTAGGAPRVSALTGAGLAELCAQLAAWLVPDPPEAGAAVPFTAALCDRVEQLWQAFQAGAPAPPLAVASRAAYTTSQEVRDAAVQGPNG